MRAENDKPTSGKQQQQEKTSIQFGNGNWRDSGQKKTQIENRTKSIEWSDCRQW